MHLTFGNISILIHVWWPEDKTVSFHYLSKKLRPIGKVRTIPVKDLEYHLNKYNHGSTAAKYDEKENRVTWKKN